MWNLSRGGTDHLLLYQLSSLLPAPVPFNLCSLGTEQDTYKNTCISAVL